jgi:hypothetical protein
MPSRATGPVPVAYWGKRPLWTPSRLRAWAAARLRPARVTIDDINQLTGGEIGEFRVAGKRKVQAGEGEPDDC